MRLSATAAADERGALLDQLRGVETFADEGLAEQDEQAATIVVADAGHEADTLVARRFVLNLHGDRLAEVDVALAVEEDQSGATTIDGVGEQFLLHRGGFLPDVLADLPLELAVLFDRFADGGHEVGHVVEQGAHLAHGVLREIEKSLGGVGCDGLDAAHTSGDGAFAGDVHGADHAGGGDVGAAAKLDGGAVAHDAHFLAVLLAEEGHRAQGFGLGDGHVAMLVERHVLADATVDDLLHAADLLVGHLAEVGEVEAERLGPDVRSFLLDVCAERLAERLVEQVGGRVVAFAADAALHVDAGCERGGEVFRELRGEVHRQVVFALRVDDLRLFAVRGDEPSAVAHLSTHLSVEGRLVEDDLVERLVFLFDAAVAEDLHVALHHVVTHEGRLTLAQRHPVVSLDGGGIACAFLLLLHLGVEALEVSVHAVLAEDQLGEVEREAVRVVEGEGVRSGQRFAARGVQLFDLFFEQTDARFERAKEGLFLFLHHLFDQLLLGHKLRISRAHGGDERREEAIHEGLFAVEEGVSITHGAAQDAADHIACLGVRGQLSVGDGEGDGADMIRHDAHRHVLLPIGAVGRARHVGDGLDERLEDVRVIVRRLALQCHTESLEAHACIDDAVGQRLQRAIGLPVILHEDEVPDLDHERVVLVHERCPGHSRTFGVGPEVDVDLRTGAAGARVAHLPKVVVLVALEDVVSGQVFGPIAGRLTVTLEALGWAALEDGGVESCRVKVQRVDQVFPRPADDFFLEIIAERPVAEHLEHGVVIRVVAHLLEVVVLTADAQTFL